MNIIMTIEKENLAARNQSAQGKIS